MKFELQRFLIRSVATAGITGATLLDGVYAGAAQ